MVAARRLLLQSLLSLLSVDSRASASVAVALTLSCSSESSWTRDRACLPCIGGRILNHWSMRGILRRRFISHYFRDPGTSRSLSGEPLGSAALRHTVVITGTSVLRVRGVHRSLPGLRPTVCSTSPPTLLRPHTSVFPSENWGYCQTFLTGLL